MKRRYQFIIYGIIVVIALIIGIRRADHLRSQGAENSTPTIHWQHKTPLDNPGSHPLTLGPTISSTIAPVTLPADQLSSAEWYLPITKHSALSFILHDSQARWVNQGKQYRLKNVPTDPVNTLSYTRNGQAIGWVTSGQNVMVLDGTSGRYTRYLHAAAVAFNAHNQPVTWDTATHGIDIGTRVLPYHISGTPAKTRPLLDQATRVVTDNAGRVLDWSLQSGQSSLIAHVDASRWPVFLTAHSITNGVAVLLERPAPIPRYLLILKRGNDVSWYRFGAYNPPELGEFHGRLIIESITTSGSLAIIEGTRIHPLDLTPGVFSSGPDGIIWESPHGFVKLQHVGH